MVVGRAQPRMLSLYATMNQQRVAYAAPPQAQVTVAPRPRAGGVFAYAEYSVLDLELMRRDLVLRLADLMRTRLARATTSAIYAMQVVKYNTNFDDVLPTEQQPYPLSPGTVDYTTNKCCVCSQARG